MYGDVKKHCAIYTRKSTDERLDMEFNTLDAQREACEAYIASQKSEGWVAAAKHYDDGGFSGGNMDRPALNELLEDIKSGRVQIIVVYKIDRLTRSLMDFAKLVEVFDEHGVTFVSVTQSFNTTTSMGRLTLNVLLSFAQFEREVSSERIRDKIRASKKRGMWMGGTPPLGYEIDNLRLVVSTDNVSLARHIFERYLALGCVSKLKRELDQEKIRSPLRTSKTGRTAGGKLFSRGKLYAMLKNPAYIGKIPHKGKAYDSDHPPIIPRDVWEAVQERLQAQTVSRREKTKRRHRLQGRLFDVNGVPYSPSFTRNNGKEYCYYLSQNLLQYRDQPEGLIARLPAQEIEGVVESAVEDFDTVERVVVDTETLTIKVREGEDIVIPYKTGRAQRGSVIIEPEISDPRDPFDLPPAELKKLVQGHIWRDEHFGGMALKDISQREGYSQAYVGTVIFESFAKLPRRAYG